MSVDHLRAQEKRFARWLPNLVNTTKSMQLSPGLNFIFVLGKPAKKNPHRLILNISENMDRGKSVEWFMAAAELFPGADLVLKMDLDTGLCPGKLRKLLDLTAKARADYIGFLKCCRVGVWPEHRRQLRALSICPRNQTGTWMYMQGSFYGLSRAALSQLQAHPLARRVRKHPPRRAHPEDMVMGALLFYVMRRPRVFSLDHVPGCANHMRFSFATGHTHPDVPYITCPVIHLNTLYFKQHMFASNRSLCDLFRSLNRSPKLIRADGRCAGWQLLHEGQNPKGFPGQCCRLPFTSWDVK